MNNEFTQLAAQIDAIANAPGFNGIKLLDATAAAAYSISLGDGTTIDLNTADMTTTGLGIGGVKAAGTYQTWVADETANWVTVTTGGNFTIAVDDTTPADDDYTLTVALTAATYSMQDIADAVNAVSRADRDYNAASIVTDDVTGLKTINIEAQTGGTGSVTMGGTVVTTGTLLETDANWLKTAGSGTAVDISTDATTAITLIEAAIVTKETFRAELGMMMNRLEAAKSVNDIQAENLAAAESRISDVDVATEMAALTRGQVLAQAGVSMLAQANSMPQMALQLLRG
jgi:flagellin